MKAPHVVYHVASMGNVAEVADEQFRLLAESGLTDVRVTHVGPGWEAVRDTAERHGVRPTLVRSDPNVNHYETFGLLEVDRLARAEQTDRPVLYLHTKGVSNPADYGKVLWRRLMNDHVVRRWRSNLGHLVGHDAVGVNWITGGLQHFSGNFWLARPDWLRRLPEYAAYHASRDFVRYACETWIGAAQYCDAVSLGCRDHNFWQGVYDYGPVLGTVPARPAYADPARTPPPADRFGPVFDFYLTDKDELHSYGDVYDALYPPARRAAVRAVVEVGVLAGSSLWAWERLFPNAAGYGFDLADHVECLAPRSWVAFGDATDPAFVEKAVPWFGLAPGSADLIVDDGSHRFADQLAAHAVLRPLLAAGGHYVVEDVQSAAAATALARAVGGVVVDRRAVKDRADDLLVVAGPRAHECPGTVA